MQNFISTLGVVDSISKPLKLFCDNSEAIAFSKNTRSICRSKHINVKFYFVKEKVAESLIDIKHMSTKSMLADPLTKGLPIVVFQEHVSTNKRLTQKASLFEIHCTMTLKKSSLFKNVIISPIKAPR